MSNPVYAATETEVAAAFDYIELESVAGVDTEFYDVDIRTQSPVARSKIHVFSIAIPEGEPNALGYTDTRTWFFPAEALNYSFVKDWFENPAVTKPLHNQPVDDHALANHGVNLRGGVNTLEMARFIYPHLARGFSRPFALDNLAEFLAGLGKTESYDDLFAYEAVEQFPTETWKKRCACGELACRKKLFPHDQKWPERVQTVVNRKVKKYLPLTDLSPAHHLWARYGAYAGRDADLALIVYQIMEKQGLKQRPFPWTPQE